MHQSEPFTLSDLEDFLPKACLRATSADPVGWSKECRLYGHGDVVALIVQRIFGGDIIRASLEHVAEHARMRSHYWNRLPGPEGEPPYEVDLTRQQFGISVPQWQPTQTLTSGQLLNDPDVKRRFERVWALLLGMMDTFLPTRLK